MTPREQAQAALLLLLEMQPDELLDAVDSLAPTPTPGGTKPPLARAIREAIVATLGGTPGPIAIQGGMDRGRAEEKRRQTQKMEAVGRLAGGIAHDFNNVLTAITGYGEMLLANLPETSLAHRHAQGIVQAAERAAELTRQLLAFSRRQVLEPRVLNLNVVIGDMEKLLRRVIGEDIEIVTVLDPTLGYVKADRGQLEQVLMNLSVNARDAMPEGGKLLIETTNADFAEVAVKRQISIESGPAILLAVSDNGTGMDQETLAHLFEPFFTTKGLGQGTGLGLATVYGIVKQSGGSIWVQSEPDEGTRFEIYLPRTEEALFMEPPRSAERPRGAETVLVVEDDDVVRALVCHVLRDAGYHVLETSDGEKALRASAEYPDPIPLLLTDVVMPGLNGRSVADALTATRAETKVIFMSGYTGAFALADSGNAFIQKPFTPTELLQSVREVLDAARN
jgi:signal transduction histidine kinase/CheY-like chemotaxis protein